MIGWTKVPLMAGTLLVASMAVADEPGTSTPTQAKQVQATDAYTQELAALVDAYDVALTAYWERVTKAMDETPRPSKGDKADGAASPDDEDGAFPLISLLPVDGPDAEFLPRFKDLAHRAKGTASGAEALIWVVELGSGATTNQDSEVALATLLGEYAQSPALQRLADVLGQMSWMMVEGKARESLRAIAKSTPHALVKAAATLNLALVMMDEQGGGKPGKEIRQLLDRVVADHASSDYAVRAAAFIFEFDHLQVGMIAPEIEGTDSAGKPFKLSSHRGQVVLLDFWGFW